MTVTIFELINKCAGLNIISAENLCKILLHAGENNHAVRKIIWKRYITALPNKYRAAEN